MYLPNMNFNFCSHLVDFTFAAEGEPAPTPNPDDKNPPEPPKGRVFTEEELQKAVEAERNRSKEQTRELLEQFERQKKAVGTTEEEKKNLQKKIDNLKNESLTREERDKAEREALVKDYEEKLSTTASDRDAWQTRFRTSEIARSLQAAAEQEKAHNSDIIKSLLIGDSDLEPVIGADGKPTGNFEVKVKVALEDGKIATMAPIDAVKRMKTNVQGYGHLFQGIGSPGLGLNNGGKNVDLADLARTNPEEFRKRMKEQNKNRK